MLIFDISHKVQLLEQFKLFFRFIRNIFIFSIHFISPAHKQLRFKTILPLNNTQANCSQLLDSFQNIYYLKFTLDFVIHQLELTNFGLKSQETDYWPQTLDLAQMINRLDPQLVHDEAFFLILEDLTVTDMSSLVEVHLSKKIPQHKRMARREAN